jgi:hypothetical protein
VVCVCVCDITFRSFHQFFYFLVRDHVLLLRKQSRDELMSTLCIRQRNVCSVS